MNEVKFNSLRVDNDLYDDEAHVIHKIIRVRHITLPKNGEDWEILENEQVSFVVKGVRLTKRERNILKTANGLNLLILEYKNGIKSVAKIKQKLKTLDY